MANLSAFNKLPITINWQGCSFSLQLLPTEEIDGFRFYTLIYDLYYVSPDSVHYKNYKKQEAIRVNGSCWRTFLTDVEFTSASDLETVAKDLLRKINRFKLH
jgi:hypothetical protein